MNKFFTKIAALALGATMAVGVGVALGTSQKVSSVSAAVPSGNELLFTINFKDNGTDSSTALTAATFYSSGVTSVTDKNGSTVTSTFSTAGISGTPSKVYPGTGGLKCGSNKNAASFTLNIPSAYQAKFTYAVINCTNATRSITLTAGGGSDTLASGNSSFGDHDLSISSTSTATTLDVSITSASKTAAYIASIAVYKATAKTLSSISVSGYKTDFTVGDTFSFGGTVTAHYSDSSTGNVTSSTTFSGYNMGTAGNYTVTASYTEGGVTKTATYGITVSAASSPTISLSGSSFSGYTGQSFSVTATYSNLTSAFAWATSGAGTTTESISSTGTSTDGTSTYSGTLTGAGIKTLTASGGGASSQTYTVNITKVTVDITKASTSIALGKSETLAATHNASAIDGLTWGSSNAKVSVNSDGKVTVANDATVGSTATITATSKVDTTVSDTCTVTVAAAPAGDEITLATTGVTSTSYASGDFSGISATNTGHTAAVYAGQIIKSSNGYIQMRATNPGGIVSTGSGGKVRGITISWDTAAMASTAKSLDVYCNTSAYSSAADLYSTSTDGDKVGSISYTNTTTYDTYLSISGDYTYVGVRSNSGAMYIQQITIEWELPNELSSVSVSFTSDPADRTFTAGSTFAFNGILTASYTVDSPKTVTPSGYFLEGEEGTGDEVTTSTILTVADFNGGDIYVQYKEGGITKYDTFTLIVNPAPATSVTLSSNVGSVALEEVFEVSSITATVNPQAYATQGVTWDIYDLGGLTSDDYDFDNGEFMASKPADVVFHVKANSNASIYAVFTLTITGDPIAHLLDGELVDVTDGSASVFGDAGTLTYGVTTENFEGTMSYTWSTTNDSVISIDDDQGDMCDFYVEGVGGSARLSCHVQGSTKGDVTVYIDVTVTAVTVTSVSWSAPTIDVFSGSSLSSTSGWNVKYSTNSGKTDQTPDSFNVKLGGTTISLPYEWKAVDDGKTLCVEVGGVSSSTTTVAVTQSINAVYAPVPGEEETSTLTFTEACGGSGTSDGGEEWTVTSDGTESTYDPTKGIHYGTGSAAVQYINLTSSDFTSGKITKVVVNASTASGVTATVAVNVGGNAFGGAPQSLSQTATEYTFEDEVDAEEIEVIVTKPSSAAKAIYCKSIAVTYSTESGETENIANNASHKAAQRVAVAYANAFNAAMADTENCTEGLDDAWSACSDAYDDFKDTAAALGETEEAWAKNLVKYATAQYSDDSGEACIERMMKTYEICVQKHGKTAFMSDLVSLGRATPNNPIAIINSDSNINVIAVVAIVSIIGVSAIGGYFFLRKRREEN